MAAKRETVTLQLAMAFGQGAGSMLARPEAIEGLLTKSNAIVDTAVANWDTDPWPFIVLVRMLGQLSATRAAAAGRAEIAAGDITRSLPAAVGLCPCNPKRQIIRPPGRGIRPRTLPNR